MILTHAICDDRPWMVKPKHVTSEWGYICCDMCKNIADTRDSWMEVYA